MYKIDADVKGKGKWIVIEGHRYNLASMTKLGIKISGDSWATGVSLEEVYYMPRKKQVILHTYSVWENPRTHGCCGDNYSLACPETIAKLAQRTHNDILMGLVPIEEDNEVV